MRQSILKLLVAALIATGTIYAGVSVGSAAMKGMIPGMMTGGGTGGGTMHRM